MSKHLLCLMALLLFLACKSSPTEQAPSPELPMATYFEELNFPNDDTLHVFLDMEEGKQIPNSVWFAEIHEGLLEKITYYPDTTGTVCHAIKRFKLNNSNIAYLLDLEQSWYEFRSLLVYDQETGRFTDGKILAYFYGGDGGQVAGETWIWKGEIPDKWIFVERRLDRWIAMTDEGEVEEKFADDASKYHWVDGYFITPQSPVDTAGLIKQFPMNYSW